MTQQDSAGGASRQCMAEALPGHSVRGRKLGLIGDIRVRLEQILYGLYEHRLLTQIREEPLPRHVGIILDGNRRFGRRHHIADPHALYALGAGKLDDVLNWCIGLAIPAVTLWVCSTKNLQRPPEDISGILAAIQNKLLVLARDPFVRQHQVRVRAAGRLDLLPASTRAAIEAAEEATSGNSALVLTIAVAYDGREELVDALKSILRLKASELENPEAMIEEISADTIAQHLYVPELPDPDLIIRTSGELRLSGFLLWQSAYSEFYFTEIDWPEFRKIDFLRALRDYQRRQRRFGL